MIGMDRETGALMTGDQHLRQSIRDILTTPLGTRPMRRDYGSLVPELLDRPLHAATALLLASAAAMAIARWEPRVTVRKVQISGDLAAGQAIATVISQRKGAAANALTNQTIPLTR
ncbi:oxidoreductase [Sphingomonas sp. S-NIH.Pt3_0716]|nr:oxidoreductase [Sphingomonas sp. S-NIH.Pt3_0716]